MDRFETAKAIADAIVVCNEAKALPEVQYSLMKELCIVCDGHGTVELDAGDICTCWRCRGAKTIEVKKTSMVARIKTTYRPSGISCINCANVGPACIKLPFNTMPVIETMNTPGPSLIGRTGELKIVKCENFRNKDSL